MAEQEFAGQSSVMPFGKDRKQRVLGLILVGLGLCLQLPYFLARATRDPCRYSSHDDDLFLQLCVLGFGLGAIGVACIARGEGLYTKALAPLVSFITIGTVLFAIPAPTFILHYSERSPQAEARNNLAGIYVAEIAFYEVHKRYGSFEEIGYTLSGAHRYTYRIDQSGSPKTVMPPHRGGQRITHSGSIEEPLTVCPSTPDNTIVPASYGPTGFTATATGNIDDDPTLDQWHVNDAKKGLDKADVNDDRS